MSGEYLTLAVAFFAIFIQIVLSIYFFNKILNKFKDKK